VIHELARGSHVQHNRAKRGLRVWQAGRSLKVLPPLPEGLYWHKFSGTAADYYSELNFQVAKACLCVQLYKLGLGLINAEIGRKDSDLVWLITYSREGVVNTVEAPVKDAQKVYERSTLDDVVARLERYLKKK